MSAPLPAPPDRAGPTAATAIERAVRLLDQQARNPAELPTDDSLRVLFDVLHADELGRSEELAEEVADLEAEIDDLQSAERDLRDVVAGVRASLGMRAHNRSDEDLPEIVADLVERASASAEHATNGRGGA